MAILSLSGKTSYRIWHTWLWNLPSVSEWGKFPSHPVFHQLGNTFITRGMHNLYKYESADSSGYVITRSSHLAKALCLSLSLPNESVASIWDFTLRRFSLTGGVTFSLEGPELGRSLGITTGVSHGSDEGAPPPKTSLRKPAFQGSLGVLTNLLPQFIAVSSALGTHIRKRRGTRHITDIGNTFQ